MLRSFKRFACQGVFVLAVVGAPQIGEAREYTGIEFDDPDFGEIELSDPAMPPKARSEWINRKSYSDEEWDEAVRVFEGNQAACDSGDHQACVAAAKSYFSGDGVWPSPRISEILFIEACEAGLGAGCTALGEALTGIYSYEYSYTLEATEYFEKGCDLGDLVACDRFANHLRDDLADAESIARADALLESSCAAGGMEACASLGRILFESGQPDHSERAFDLLDKACRNGALSGCETLTQRVVVDEARLVPYLHYACYLGSFGACSEIGDRVYEGRGARQDRDLAVIYYDKACAIDQDFCDVAQAFRALPGLRAGCEAGEARACAGLGQALALPYTPETDTELAFELLQSSCRNGAGLSCPDAAERISPDGGRADRERLAQFYEEREQEQQQETNCRGPHRISSCRPSTPPNFEQEHLDRIGFASEMLERGCEVDDPRSCFTLARMLGETPLDENDQERAVQLFARLCDAGFRPDENSDACEHESRYYGYVLAARPLAANEEYRPPMTFEEMAEEYLRCLIYLLEFRGRVYRVRNCPRVERGIGSYRLEPGQAPWQALIWRPKVLAGETLDDQYRVTCGGSLIATGWVLTAAHCLNDVSGTHVGSAGHRIRLGVFNPNRDEGISYPILRTIAHPSFNKANGYVFDIALIQYDHRAGEKGEETNSIRPIALDTLPVGERRIEDGMLVYAYGWGRTALNAPTTDYLQGIKMELANEQACTEQTRFRGRLSNAALCAGGPNGEQACFGDSGGPLVYYGDGRGPVLIGIVSAGKKCGTTGQLSQYTRVARARAWIDRYVRVAP